MAVVQKLFTDYVISRFGTQITDLTVSDSVLLCHIKIKIYSRPTAIAGLKTRIEEEVCVISLKLLQRKTRQRWSLINRHCLHNMSKQ